MIKTITKIGNSQGIILDAAIMDMARLKVGDQVNIEVHESGTLTVSPLKPAVSRRQFKKTLDGVLADYKKTLKKLA